MSSDDIRLEYEAIDAESSEAYLFDFGSYQAWLPKSQIRVYTKRKSIYMPLWLAQNEGLSL